MLIGLLQASVEHQSLTIRKNNDFLWQSPLLTGEGLAFIAGLRKVPVDPERELCLANASCLFQGRRLPLLELIFTAKERNVRGTVRDLVSWVMGDSLQTWAGGYIVGTFRRNLCLLNARGQWIVKWVSLEPFLSRHVPKCFAGTVPSLQVQPCCCGLQPRRDRGSVCIKAFSLTLLCLLFIVRRLWVFQCGPGWGTTHLGVCREDTWKVLSFTDRLEAASGFWHPEAPLCFPCNWHQRCLWTSWHICPDTHLKEMMGISGLNESLALLLSNC